MVKIKKNEAGFSAVEVIIVLIVIVLIGAVGYLVYESHHKTATTTTTTKSSTSTKTATAPDPYAGWKSYCDSAGNCFKYPADWAAVTSGPTGPEPGNFKNPAQTLKIVSGTDNSKGTLTDPAQWYTSSLASLSTASDKYKVWGGYLAATGAYVPQYAVVDASKVGDGNLAVGQTKSTTDDTYISYTVDGGSQHYDLGVFAVSNDAFTKSSADSWFNSADAKTALLIVQSYYKQ